MDSVIKVKLKSSPGSCGQDLEALHFKCVAEPSQGLAKVLNLRYADSQREVKLHTAFKRLDEREI